MPSTNHAHEREPDRPLFVPVIALVRTWHEFPANNEPCSYLSGQTVLAVED